MTNVIIKKTENINASDKKYKSKNIFKKVQVKFMLEPKMTNQTKQDFQFTLSKVSHEIRNPLTLINSYLQLVEKAHPEVEEYEYWDDILDQMDFLKKLLGELSIYNNSRELHKESVCIASYLEKLTQKLAPTYKYLGIDLNYENYLPDADATLYLDKIKFQQALLNLIRNAGESIAKNGAIHIILKKERNNLCIQIADNGCGIEPEHLSTLFDPFITHKKTGTGLGLAIVKQVVNAHGGRVELTSYPNEGTTFTLLFPYE